MSRFELPKEDQNVKVSVEKKEGSVVSLEVEAPVEVVQEALDKAYRSMVKRVTVPGFRKGKAPRHLLERHVGKEALAEEAMRDTLPGLYEQAVEEAKIEPVDDPEFDDIHFEQGEPVKFKAQVYVRPEVVLGDYESISVPFENPTLTDEEVDSQFELLRERMADLRPLPEDAQLVQGNYVTCHVTGIEGEDFKAEIDQDLNYVEVGGEIPMIPGLGEALIGMNKGETKEFVGVYRPQAENVPADDAAVDAESDEEAAKAAETDAPSENTAEAADSEKGAASGTPEDTVADPQEDAAEADPDSADEDALPKSAKFSVTVKETYQKHIPDDEEVLKNMNKATLEEAKAELRQRIMAIKVDRARKQFTDKVEDAVIEKAAMDIPRVMILRRAEDILRRFDDRLKEAGTDLGNYLASSGRSVDELREEVENQARAEVRRDLALDALAEKEQIQVSQQTIDRVVEALAKEAGREVGTIRTTLQLRGAMASIEQDLARVEAVRKLAVEAALRAGTPLPAEEVEMTEGAESETTQDELSAPAEGAADGLAEAESMLGTEEATDASDPVQAKETAAESKNATADEEKAEEPKQ
jgi:trigger factor